MSLVPLHEFQHIAGLSDSSLLWLLKKQLLPVSVDPERGILVDTRSADLRTMVQAIAECKVLAAGKASRIIGEKCARIIRQELDQILTEAIAKVSSRSGQN